MPVAVLLVKRKRRTTEKNFCLPWRRSLCNTSSMTQAKTKLARLRKSRRLTRTEAAKEIGCSRVGLIGWETGRRVPGFYWRFVIERWSGGSIVASSWPVSRRDAVAAARYAA